MKRVAKLRTAPEQVLVLFFALLELLEEIPWVGDGHQRPHLDQEKARTPLEANVATQTLRVSRSTANVHNSCLVRLDVVVEKNRKNAVDLGHVDEQRLAACRLKAGLSPRREKVPEGHRLRLPERFIELDGVYAQLNVYLCSFSLLTRNAGPRNSEPAALSAMHSQILVKGEAKDVALFRALGRLQHRAHDKCEDFFASFVARHLAVPRPALSHGLELNSVIGPSVAPVQPGRIWIHRMPPLA
mmetsp:Transcript_76642/g.213002  ORF Transcript_76642/g.213002 Transcript_76642/m.213002 type:complete len:243 (+) Transcript_76642:3014-3742(+)